MKIRLIILICIVACVALLGVLFRLHRAVPAGGETLGNSLTAAVMVGDLEKLKKLESRGVDLNTADSNRFGWTPLIAAAYFQQTNVTSYLLAKNVDLTIRDAVGNAALFYAISFDDTNTGKLLLQRSKSMSEDWGSIVDLVKTKPTSNVWLQLLPQRASEQPQSVD